jgi:hypothetical protein
VQDKIYKIIKIIGYQRWIQEKYLKHIEGSKGLYKPRISLGTDIWRIFCFFDEGKLVFTIK